MTNWNEKYSQMLNIVSEWSYCSAAFANRPSKNRCEDIRAIWTTAHADDDSAAIFPTSRSRCSETLFSREQERSPNVAHHHAHRCLPRRSRIYRDTLFSRVQERCCDTQTSAATTTTMIITSASSTTTPSPTTTMADHPYEPLVVILASK
jgi:hypothetical protein